MEDQIDADGKNNELVPDAGHRTASMIPSAIDIRDRKPHVCGGE